MKLKSFNSYLFSTFLLFFISGCCIPYRANIKISSPVYEILGFQKRNEGLNPVTRSQAEQKEASIDKVIQDYKQNTLEEINQYLAEHLDVSDQIKQNLFELKIAEGMNREQVGLLLGDRVKIYSTKEYGADELWVFPITALAEYWKMYFKDGILIRLNQCGMNCP